MAGVVVRDPVGEPGSHDGDRAPSEELGEFVDTARMSSRITLDSPEKREGPVAVFHHAHAGTGGGDHEFRMAENLEEVLGEARCDPPVTCVVGRLPAAGLLLGYWTVSPRSLRSRYVDTPTPGENWSTRHGIKSDTSCSIHSPAIRGPRIAKQGPLRSDAPPEIGQGMSLA